MKNHPGSSRWDPNAVTSVPVRGTQREIGDRQKRGGNVTMDAGTGGMLPQVKECDSPQKLNEAKEIILPGTSTSTSLPTP